MRPLLVICLLVLGLSAVAPPALAQGKASYNPIEAAAELEALRSRLQDPQISSDELGAIRNEVVALQLLADQCVTAATADRARLEALYEPLKDITPEAETAAFEQYLATRTQLEAAIARQASCAATLDQAKQLASTISRLQTERSEEVLSKRRENIIAGLRDVPSQLARIPELVENAFGLELVEGFTPILLFWVLVAGASLAGLVGIFLRLRFNKIYEEAGGEDAPPRLRFLFPKPLALHSPLLLSGVTLAVILFGTIRDAATTMVVIRMALGVSLYGAFCVVIDWSTGPLSPAASIKGLIPKHVAPLRRRLRIWFLTLVISFVLLGTGWLAIPTVAVDVPGRALSIFLVAVSQLVVITYLARIPGLRGRFRLIRIAAMLTVLIGIVALLAGFHNFAAYLVYGVTRTALALFLLWILLWCVQVVFEFLNRIDAKSAKQIRSSLGIPEKSRRTGLGLVQLVTDLSIWVAFIGFVIYVWDDAGTTVGSLYEYAVKGITVGQQITLVPAKIALGILVFATMVIVLGWIKNWIDKRWLEQIVTEPGAREALVTLFGYVGFIIAILIGLSLAGIDLTGLAFISAALALGIGFGMQEIASNFVSGLILLFERPIRSGDFVTVGNIDGFVRRIRIRATEIETLDNQNVLVPNSELVSGRVTNWVLRDTAGRLLVRVGVAYGSDVELVRELLEAAGREHNEVITDGSAPAPRALFMGFGDSSLDFELRVRVHRIDRRFTVLSDLNFAINKAFRENGVVVPFPQRDLHVVSYPDESKARAAAVAPPAREDTFGRTQVPLAGAITRQHIEQVHLDAVAEKVWATLTGIEAQKKWLVEDGEFNAVIGGQFHWVFGELVNSRGTTAEGRIDIFVPNYRMRLVLSPSDGGEPLPTGPLTLDFRLHRRGEHTDLQVIAGGFPAEEDWEEDFNWFATRLGTAARALTDLVRKSS